MRLTDGRELEEVLAAFDERLSRIESALGFKPMTNDELKRQKQLEWFAGSESWRDELRKGRGE
jgi:hypothetical protein